MGAIQQRTEQALGRGKQARFITWRDDCRGSDMPID
jgi:hypothetical protein